MYSVVTVACNSGDIRLSGVSCRTQSMHVFTIAHVVPNKRKAGTRGGNNKINNCRRSKRM